MRTPAVVVVLLAALGACGDTAAPHGANLQTLSGSQLGACGRGETQLRCWGSQGLLTGGGTAPTPIQPGAPISGLELVRNKPYEEGGCGLDGDGALFCWGLDGSGYAAVAPHLRFTDVTLGQDAQCALSTSGTVYCWGVAWATGVPAQDTAIRACGETPYTYECVPEPAPIASDQRFTAVASGLNHTCAVAQSGQVFCWGGVTGAGPDVQSSQTPVPVASPDRFRALSSASEGSCAVNNDGRVLCWGYDYGGMLGASDGYLSEPTPIELPSGVAMKSVALGYSHSCALDTTGTAWCWGTGGLGTGGTSSATPARVLGGLTFSALAAGSEYTCGITGNGAWCWGSNNYGQLGNGGRTHSPIPVRVANQDQFDD